MPAAARTLRMRPIVPASTSSAIRRCVALSVTNGAQTRRRSAARAASTIRRADSRSSAMGFSTSTCFPASRAAVASAAWPAGGVRTITASTSAAARTSSGRVVKRSTAKSARTAASTSGRTSHATTSRAVPAAVRSWISGRYGPNSTLPQPMTPMRTGEAGEVIGRGEPGGADRARREWARA